MVSGEAFPNKKPVNQSQLVSEPRTWTTHAISMVAEEGVAMDDERQMSTLHPKQRGEHAGARAASCATYPTW